MSIPKEEANQRNTVIPSVTGSADDATSSTIADREEERDVSFLTVYARLKQYGLRVLLKPGDFDARTLCRIARDSIGAEEFVATGCLLVQSVALVRAWMLLHNQTVINAENQESVVLFGQASVRVRHMYIDEPHD